MSRARLVLALQTYPVAVRDQIEGYVDALRDRLPELFEDAGVRLTEPVAADVIFLAGVRKLWGMIDGQYSVLDHSLSILAERNTPSVRFGQTQYSRTSAAYRQVRDLRNDLLALLRQLEVLDLVEMPLTDLVREVALRGSADGR